MGIYSGSQFTVLLVDGYNILPSLSESASMGMESLTQQTNQFGATSETHTPLNVEKGALVVGNGFFDATTNALLGVFNAVRGLRRIICAAIEDNVIGRHFMGFVGAYDQKYELIDQRDGLTKANAAFLVDGDVKEGVIVQHLATFSATWDTKTGGAGAPDAPVDYTVDVLNRQMDIASNSQANPTVVTMKTQHGAAIPHGLTSGDKVLFSGSNSTPSLNGVQTVTVTGTTTFTVPVNVTVAGTAGSFVRCNTRAGGVGFMQVTAYTGSTEFVNKIMHSPDDVTYAALVTFTGLGSNHVPAKQVVTAAGNVDRYLSNQGTLTGAGSITVFAGFSRS